MQVIQVYRVLSLRATVWVLMDTSVGGKKCSWADMILSLCVCVCVWSKWDEFDSIIDAFGGIIDGKSVALQAVCQHWALSAMRVNNPRSCMLD